MEASAATSVPHGTPRSHLARLGRLTLKELRETLRDRRTIVTLVLMPMLLYPVLSVGFRQLLGSSLSGVIRPRYQLVVRNPMEKLWLLRYLGLQEEKVEPEKVFDDPSNDNSQPRIWLHAIEQPEASVRDYTADVEIRFPKPLASPPDVSGDQDLALELLFVYMEDSTTGERAAAFLERRLAAANDRFLTARLSRLGQTQRAPAIHSARISLETRSPRDSAGALVTLAPLILILMTITGAVYPAIDLTAGERERGTLEILVAAPVPRLGLLLAKYVSVLTVALLTATVNLTAMTATIIVGGLGPLLFGTTGLTVTLALEILGLLFLFAMFFSAVLLTLTSFARTFKEAQAYLIPLMMVAIAPGLLSLMPRLELTGALMITPLANIVLLARDLLQQQAHAGAAVVVVISTMLYAVAAISVAARFFAAESVLYTTESGWSDFFQRPRTSRPWANPANGMFCVALIFPAYFVALNLVMRVETLPVKLLLSALATLAVFGGVPLAVSLIRRVEPVSAFRCGGDRPGRWLLALPGAALMGLGLWALAHEAIVLEIQWGLVTLSPLQRAQVAELQDQLRGLSPAWVLLTLAVAPAVGEELFFRGYLFSSISSKAGPWSTILATALLFGFFHVVTPTGISLVRLLPSIYLGVALGWLAWRSGSLWPSMLLHACNNGLLLLVTIYAPELEQAGFGVEEESHLPIRLFLAATATAVIGIGWVAGVSRQSAVGSRDEQRLR